MEHQNVEIIFLVFWTNEVTLVVMFLNVDSAFDAVNQVIAEGIQ